MYEEKFVVLVPKIKGFFFIATKFWENAIKWFFFVILNEAKMREV